MNNYPPVCFEYTTILIWAQTKIVGVEVMPWLNNYHAQLKFPYNAMDKAYIVMKKVIYDVIQKGKKVT